MGAGGAGAEGRLLLNGNKEVVTGFEEALVGDRGVGTEACLSLGSLLWEATF